MYTDDETRLRHMLDAAREAVGFARERTRNDLVADRMFRRALVSCLQEIGEAAMRITSVRRNEVADIPWQHVIGLRHRVVHDYVNIRVDVVWDTVTDDLPPLIAALERVLPTSSEG